MKRLIVLGVTALLFVGCTITFDNGNNDNNNNPNLAVTVTSPTNNSVIGSTSYIVSGTVVGGFVNIAKVEIKIGVSGSYVYVSGTSNLSAATAQSWSYNVSGSPTGYVVISVKATDVESNYVTTLRSIYVGSTPPSIAITSPANGTYYEIANYSSGINLIGTVQGVNQISYVYARMGISSAGAYSAVAGTQNISAISPKAWTNNFDISLSSSGTKYFYTYAKDVSNKSSVTNSVYFYLLDEWEDNGSSASADTITADNTLYRARIGTAPDIDWFEFSITSTGFHVFYTTNANMGTPVDTCIVLYAQNGSTILAQNDDAVSGVKYSMLNFNIPSTGTYYLSVAHYQTNGTGDYAVAVYKP